jgi:hypothetical protein
MNWIAIPCYRNYRSWLLSLSCGHTRKVTHLLHANFVTCRTCGTTEGIRATIVIPETS